MVFITAGLLKAPSDRKRNHISIHTPQSTQDLYLPVSADHCGMAWHGMAWHGMAYMRDHRVHKVDVSYLSPHVNMSARLEAATKQFGVPLLMSGSFVKLLSADVK